MKAFLTSLAGFAFVLTSHAMAATYYVAPAGSDSYAGTSPSTPFKTVQKSLDAVRAGDTVNIMAGTYTESLIIKTSGTRSARITVQPYGNDTVILKAPASTRNIRLAISSGGYYTFSHLTFIGSFYVWGSWGQDWSIDLGVGGPSWWGTPPSMANDPVMDDSGYSPNMTMSDSNGYNGFIVEYCNITGAIGLYGHNNIIRYNTIEGKETWHNGIRNGSIVAHHNLYTHNTIHGMVNRGVWLLDNINYEEVSYNTIYNDAITSNHVAVDFDCVPEPGHRNLMLGNVAWNMHIAYQFENQFRSIMDGNIAYNFSSGAFTLVAYGADEGVTTEWRNYPQNNIVRNNIAWGGSSGAAISSGSSQNSWILNNTVDGCSWAMDFTTGGTLGNIGANNATIKNNIISNSTREITQSGSTGLTIINNLFYANTNAGLRGSNYQTGNPLYTDRANHNFSIQKDSAAIDHGTDPGTSFTDPYGANISISVPGDFTGKTSRPQGNGYDIGAYEFTTGGGQGVTYYVAPTGNDTNAGTLTAPFAKVQKCLSTVQPGDTCMLRAGTYYEALVLGASGTASAPITVQNYNGETVTINSGDAQALRTNGRKNYYTFDGLRFISNHKLYPTYTNTDFTLGMSDGVWDGVSSTTGGNNGFIFRNCYIEGALHFYGHGNLVENCEFNGRSLWGNGIWEAFGASHNNTYRNNRIHNYVNRGIWSMQYTDSVLIENNIVHDVNTSDSGAMGIDIDGAGHPCTNAVVRGNTVYNINAQAIQLENGFNSIVEKNVLYDSGSGVFSINYGLNPGGGIYNSDAEYRNIKTNNIIRNNVIYRALRSGVELLSSSGNNVYNNTIYNTIASTGWFAGIALTNDSSSYFSNYNQIIDNIVSGNSSHGVWIEDPATGLLGLVMSHNIYYSATNSNSHYNSRLNRNYTLAAFQSAFGLESGSRFIDPLFMNASAGDFRLQSSSLARDAGLCLSSVSTDITGAPRPQTGCDIGAYEFAGGPVPTPTSTPTPTPTPTPTLSVSPTPTPSPTMRGALAIHAGGTAYRASNGINYQADAYFTGGTTTSTVNAISGTADPALYRTERYGNFSYAIPLANGNYSVTLKFAEAYFTSAGKRVFNVAINDKTVISQLDLFAAAGLNVAYDRTFPISISNGMLKVAFTGVVNYAKVCAILVTPSAVPSPSPSPTPIPSYSISASAGNGGNISPAGTITVARGGSQAFGFTANTGYKLANVIADGVSQGAIANYIFSNVTANHTISAGFTQLTYIITSKADANGTILCPGGPIFTVGYGESTTCTITPSLGYSVSSVTVDGTSVGIVSSYTFSNVKADHTISATFAPLPAPGGVVFATNAGGSAYSAVSGLPYKADTGFTGGSVGSTPSPIQGTADPALYQSERYGNFQYKVPVINGNYSVTLKFAEIFFSSAGQRVFSVRLNGQQVITDLDIYSKVGKNAAYDLSLPVTVTNGAITLEFISKVNYAKVGAILIAMAPGSVVFADNAGGNRYISPDGTAYSADAKYVGGTASSVSATISGTREGGLYQSERYGNFSYTVPAPNGAYSVRLKFAEIYFSSAGSRVFNVRINNQLVISNLDLYAKVGKNQAYDVVIPVNVTGGTINIAFESVVNFAKISGILITTR